MYSLNMLTLAFKSSRFSFPDILLFYLQHEYFNHLIYEVDVLLKYNNKEIIKYFFIISAHKDFGHFYGRSIH